MWGRGGRRKNPPVPNPSLLKCKPYLVMDHRMEGGSPCGNSSPDFQRSSAWGPPPRWEEWGGGERNANQISFRLRREQPQLLPRSLSTEKATAGFLLLSAANGQWPVQCTAWSVSSQTHATDIAFLQKTQPTRAIGTQTQTHKRPVSKTRQLGSVRFSDAFSGTSAAPEMPSNENSPHQTEPQTSTRVPGA